MHRNGRHYVRGYSTCSEQDKLEEHCSPHGTWTATATASARWQRHVARTISRLSPESQEVNSTAVTVNF